MLVLLGFYVRMVLDVTNLKTALLIQIAVLMDVIWENTGIIIAII